MKGLLRSCLVLLSLVCVNAFAALSGPSSSTGNYTLTWTDTGKRTCYSIDRNYAYELKESFNGGGYSTIQITSDSTQSYPFTNKSPGTYRYYLRARKCSYSYSLRYYWSDTSEITVTVTEVAPTSAPTLTGATTSTGETVYVNWNSVPGATRYEVEQRNRTTNTNWSIKQNTSSRSYKVTNLSTGRYEYRVRACNSGGCSSNSAIRTVRFVNKPGTITTFNYPSSPYYGSNVPFSWSAPSNVEYYKFEVGSGSPIYWFSKTQLSPSGGTTENHSPGMSGTVYFKVEACLEFEAVEACSTARQTPAITIYGPPSTPSSITAPSLVGTDFPVSWGSSSGSPSQYVLERKINSGNYGVVQSGTLTRSYTQTSVAERTYRYRVKACRGTNTNCSGWRYTSDVLGRKPAAPGTPTGPGSSDSGSYTISWSSVSNTTHYRLEERKGSGSFVQIYSGDSTSQPYTGKSTGVYDYRVLACNDVGCSAYSGIRQVDVARAPSMPSFQSIPSSHGAPTLNVSWGAVSGVNYHYNFDYSSDGGSTWNDTTNTTSTSRSVPTANQGSFRFRVQACSKADSNTTCSGYRTSGTVNVVGVPGNPSFVNLPTNIFNPFDVRWTAPSNTSYVKLREQHAGSTEWFIPFSGQTTYERFTGASGTYHDTSPIEGMQFYRISACNSFDYCSGWVNTPPIYGRNPSHAPTFENTATSSNNGNINLNWSAVEYANQFRVERKNGTSWSLISSSVVGNSIALNEASEGSYTYRVTPCNYFGCEESQSGEVSVDVIYPPEEPLAISVEDVSNGATSIFWWPKDDSANVTGYLIQYKFWDSNNYEYTDWHDFKVVPAPSNRFDTQVSDFPFTGASTYDFRIATLKTVGNTTLESTFVSEIRDNQTQEYAPASMMVRGGFPKLELNLAQSDTDGNYEISWNDPGIDGYGLTYVLQEYTEWNWKNVEVFQPWYQKTFVYDQPEGTYTYRVMTCSVSSCGYGDVDTIVVNYEGMPTFSISGSQTVSEGGNVSLNIVKSGTHQNTYALSYYTKPGTASDDDFVPVSGEIIFTPEMNQETIAISIVEDVIDEPTQNFQFVIEHEGIELDSVSISVLDDDSAPTNPQVPAAPANISVPSRIAPGEDHPIWWSPVTDVYEGSALEYELQRSLGVKTPAPELGEGYFTTSFDAWETVYTGQSNDVMIDSSGADLEDYFQYRVRTCNGDLCSEYRTMKSSVVIFTYIERPEFYRIMSRRLAGTTNHSFEVNNKGEAVVNVPIEVVPGVNGLQPNISINYNSSAAAHQTTMDGVLSDSASAPLRAGWSLNAHSEIRQCSKGMDDVLNIYGENNPYAWEIDPDSQRPGRTENENRLCLDGELLILVSGSHLEVGAEYRTEQESYKRITIMEYGSLYGFKVEMPNGNVAEYGTGHYTRWPTTDDANAANRIPRVWAVAKVTDPFGNEMSYTYNIHEGEDINGNDENYESATHFTVRTILYGGYSSTAGGSKLKQHSVRFSYSSSSNILNRIDVLSGSGSIVREYYIGKMAEGNRSAPYTSIDYIQMCKRSELLYNNYPAVNCAAPVRFRYGQVYAYRGSDGVDSWPRLLASVHDGLGGLQKVDYSPIFSHCNHEFPSDFDGDPQNPFYSDDRASDINSPDVQYMNELGAHTERFGLLCRGGDREFPDEDEFVEINDAGYRVGYAVASFRTRRNSMKEDYDVLYYNYKDAGFYDTQGRGFAGYGGIRITNPQKDEVIYKSYRLGGLLSGRLYGEKVYKGSTLVSKTINVHDVLEFDYGTDVNNQTIKTYLPVLLQSHSENNGPELSSGSVTTIRNTFDNNFIDTTTKTTIVGQSISDNVSLETSNPRYRISYPSKTVSGDVRSTTETLTNLNFSGDDDWRIGFVSSKLNATTIEHTNENHRTKQVDSHYTPWLNTMAIGRKEVFVGQPDKNLVTEFSHDIFGNVTETTVSGPSIDTRTSSNTYENGQVLSTSTNALNHTTLHYTTSTPSDSYGYDAYDAHAMVPHSFTDPNGVTSSSVEHHYGKAMLSTDANGNTTDVRSVPCAPEEHPYYYCPLVKGYDGYVAPAFYTRKTADNAPDSISYHDRRGRVIRVESDSFNEGHTQVVETIYDHEGRVFRKTLPYVPALGETPEYIETHYDDYDRIVAVYQPSGASSTIEYAEENGLQRIKTTTVVVTSEGEVTKVKVNYLNTFGQLVESVDAVDTVSEISTVYDYDAAGNMVETIVNGDNSTRTTMLYDDAGRRTEITEPNSGTTVTVYDALGQISSVTDANQNTTTFEYDVLGRVTLKEEPENAYTWEYDPEGGPVGVVYRETHNVDEYEKTYHYEDDEIASRLTQVVERIKVNGGFKEATTEFTYDEFGRLDTTRYAQGTRIRTEYNDRGYPVRWVEDATDTVLKEIEHTSSRESLVVFGNGVETYTARDHQTGQVTEIEHYSDAFYLQQLYTWDTSGNLEQRLQNNTYFGDGVAETFEYNHHDAVASSTIYQVQGGVLSSSASRTRTYDYDALGNLKQKYSDRASDTQVRDYQYNNESAPHQLTSTTVDGVEITLHYSGNTGAIERYQNPNGSDKFISYNQMNKPTQIVVGNSLADADPESKDTFSYGPSGRRYKKVSSWKDGAQRFEETKLYFSDGTEITLHEDSHEFAETRKVMLTPGVQRISRVYSYGAQSFSYQYLHTDYQGSVIAATDASGAELYSLAYEPFGARRENDWQSDITDLSITDIVSDDLVSKRGYTGHEHLDKSGFIHMNGRLYDPTLGRFLSPDPIVQNPTNSQNYNRYMYVFNNPMKYTDPSGYRSRRATITDTGLGGFGAAIMGFNSFFWSEWFSYARTLSAELNARSAYSQSTKVMEAQVAEKMEKVVEETATGSGPVSQVSDPTEDDSGALTMTGPPPGADIKPVSQNLEEVLVIGKRPSGVGGAASVGGSSMAASSGTSKPGKSTLRKTLDTINSADPYVSAGEVAVPAAIAKIAQSKANGAADIKVNKFTPFPVTNTLQGSTTLKVLGGAGNGLFLLGAGLSITDGVNAYFNNDGFGMFDASLNMGVNLVGAFGGVWGAAASATYQLSNGAATYVINNHIGYENVVTPIVDYACRRAGC